MAKQINVSVGGVVKKVKEVPLGIGGVVKKAKSGKCGVGGVVKTFFESNLVLYDNGETDYTWEGATNSSGYLQIGTTFNPGSSGYGCYISTQIDISNYSKLRVTLVDPSDSVSTYKNGIMYLFDVDTKQGTFGIAEKGWTRSPDSTITLTMPISDSDLDSGEYERPTFQFGLAFRKFDSEWLDGRSFVNQPKIQKIWFE